MSGRTAIVTGASRGIGKAIAASMAKAGHTVLGTATSTAGADQISETLEGRGHGFLLDVSDPNSINAFIGSIGAQHDPPLVLVNNAGITRDNLALRMKDEEWQEVIDTNLTGIFRLTKLCLRGMVKARWGRIINLTSVVGAMGNAGQGNYAAAKAGILGYSKSLAAELASRNITVNCVAPGLIGTDMTDELDAEQHDKMLTRIPLGRLGDASEVADLVVFLAGESAGYITGETVHINGGLYMN